MIRIWRSYNFMPKARVVTFVALALLPGCIILDGTPGSSGGMSGGEKSGGGKPGGIPPTACPRTPDVGGTTPGMLDADKLAKVNEICQWQIALYEKMKWNVLYTVQMPSGDKYDFIDMSGVPDEQVEPPPAPSALTLPPGFEPLPTERDLFPLLDVPKGTQFRVRPDFPRYINENTGATSVDEYIKMYLVPGTPTGANRLYAGISTYDSANPASKYTYNVGASAWVMPYAGPIEPGTLSLLEMAVGCRNTVTNETDEPGGRVAIGVRGPHRAAVDRRLLQRRLTLSFSLEARAPSGRNARRLLLPPSHRLTAPRRR